MLRTRGVCGASAPPPSFGPALSSFGEFFTRSQRVRISINRPRIQTPPNNWTSEVAEFGEILHLSTHYESPYASLIGIIQERFPIRAQLSVTVLHLVLIVFGPYGVAAFLFGLVLPQARFGPR